MDYPFDFITDFIFVRPARPLPVCDVILVPGGSHTQLMYKAAELYKQGLAEYIIVSGGHNFRLPDGMSEARFLKDIGIREGIPEEKILCDEKAQNTYENALYSYGIIKDRGLKVQKALLVCKPYHSRRALLSYQKVFPADTEFYVETIEYLNGISRDNWYTKEEYVKKVMSEVQKIGSYFADDIVGFYNRQK